MRAIGFGASVLTGPVMGCWFLAMSQIVVTEWCARSKERVEMIDAAFPFAIDALLSREKIRVLNARVNFWKAQVQWDSENTFASS